ncbi:YgjP-like metallopeptidase domain-containing protein [Thalassomonas actiniarum]|uniref:M48 family metallopeptidase n=1 Tax=Thalassomonas actiniarum TaxID=485447 RepID=A0AAF0C2M8_9GAMM|nr:YgjP-like metallopeptidase domain-containing protein [Thalassomonas actiniarum]WDD97824.1 M48 family metallopeptidase [Thalassomonas actiniarum]
MTEPLKYLAAYAPDLKRQAQQMLAQKTLADYLRTKYPDCHQFTRDHELRDYVQALKSRHMKKSAPLSKVIYDNKIHVVNNALGLHTYVSRVQGGKLKSKNEIRISAVFKKSPEAFLKMIVVHELAHLKEKAHNKAFYQLCQHMLSNYHQLELDMRLYLTELEINGEVY